MKRISKTRQDRIFELERGIGKEKENVSMNITKAPELKAIEQENSILKKKLQEFEEKANLQTDDVKASVKQEELDSLKKKYDMARRLCNLRNDDNSKLQKEITRLSEELSESKTWCDSKAAENKKIMEKYGVMKDICERRFEKIRNLKARLGEAPEAD